MVKVCDSGVWMWPKISPSNSLQQICWNSPINETKRKNIFAHLWPLCLNPPHTPWAIDDCVLWDDLTGIDLTKSSDDAATGKDHIPTNISYANRHKKSHKKIKSWSCTSLFFCLQFSFVFFGRTMLPTFWFYHIVVPNFQSLRYCE